jgi:cytochrome c oxidase assembly factor CtaG
MPYGLSNSWPWSPGVLIFLVLLCVLYVLGIRRVQRAYGRQGAQDEETPVTGIRVVAFFASVLLIALVLLTPLNTIARTQLFLAHMIQAIILTTICAPLMLAGCPESVLKPVASSSVSRRLARFLTLPLLDSVIFNLVFLLWHAPLFYHAALLNPALYDVEMLSIFAASLLNWWPLIGSVRELKQIGYPMQIVYTFFDGLPMDIFAFVLVYSGVRIYAYYTPPPQLGISGVADQAAAGALLLLPGLVDFVVMSPLFFKWLSHMERQTREADERRQALAEEDEEDYELVYEEDASEISGNG